VPIRAFELACALIIVATLFTLSRRAPWRTLLGDYGALAVAGWVGEETCILAYRFYAYAPSWDAHVDRVPILVPLIWPLVVMSARDVSRALFPRAGGFARAAIVGVIVCLDASLVEVVAVRAELWSWAEGGHLDVPLIGILGWGYFAFGADLALSRLPRVSVIALAPLTTHALLLTTWWGFFRWVLRGDLGQASLVGMVAISALLTALVVRARRAGDGIPLAVAGPRMIAAGALLRAPGERRPSGPRSLAAGGLRGNTVSCGHSPRGEWPQAGVSEVRPPQR